MSTTHSGHMLLLDTNVWLDNYNAERPHAEEARALINHALTYEIPLLYSPLSLKDVFFITTLSLKQQLRKACNENGVSPEQQAQAAKEFAWGCVNNMQEIATAIGLDQSDAWLAKKYRGIHNDIEDNLILAAAHRVPGCYLVTEDVQLRSNAPIPALTSQAMLSLLPAEEFTETY